jgi:hypothetical protein
LLFFLPFFLLFLSFFLLIPRSSLRRGTRSWDRHTQPRRTQHTMSDQGAGR